MPRRAAPDPVSTPVIGGRATRGPTMSPTLASLMIIVGLAIFSVGCDRLCASLFG